MKENKIHNELFILMALDYISGRKSEKKQLRFIKISFYFVYSIVNMRTIYMYFVSLTFFQHPLYFPNGEANGNRWLVNFASLTYKWQQTHIYGLRARSRYIVGVAMRRCKCKCKYIVRQTNRVLHNSALSI